MLDASASPDPSPPALRWTDWPARRQPARSAVAALVIGLTALAVAFVDGWLALVTVGVLGWATSDVLLPATWTLDARGVTVTRLGVGKQHPWSRFTGFRQTAEGFVLVGRGHRPALRRARTVVLRCTDRTEVAAVLDQQLPRTA